MKAMYCSPVLDGTATVEVLFVDGHPTMMSAQRTTMTTMSSDTYPDFAAACAAIGTTPEAAVLEDWNYSGGELPFFATSSIAVRFPRAPSRSCALR